MRIFHFDLLSSNSVTYYTLTLLIVMVWSLDSPQSQGSQRLGPSAGLRKAPSAQSDEVSDSGGLPRLEPDRISRATSVGSIEEVKFAKPNHMRSVGRPSSVGSSEQFESAGSFEPLESSRPDRIEPIEMRRTGAGSSKPTGSQTPNRIQSVKRVTPPSHSECTLTIRY